MFQILERASVLRRFLLERRSFQLWHAAVETQHLIRNAFNQTINKIRRSTSRRVLTTLQSYSRVGRLKREQQLRVKVFWTFRLLRRSLTRWYYFMHQSQLGKQMQQRADKKWKDYRLGLIMRGWKQVLTAREPDNPVLNCRILTKWFWRWNSVVSQKKRKINNPREKKTILARRHYERKLMRAVYDGWERARFSSRLAREVAQHSLEASAMEVAVSWFVKALVKRFLICWKKQAAVQKNYRRNHWHAVVHFKMQSVAKGLRGLRENVEVGHFKQTLQRLSIKSYQESLKRKAVTGCKLLHQSKRLKSAQLEHATAQWKTVKLQERFDKWYFATALKSMKKNQLLKSVSFSHRQLCLRGFQAWRAVRDLSKKKKSLKETRLTRLRESLGKLRRMQVLRAWKSLRKEMNIKRFNEARALQFFLGFKAAAVVKALHIHMQEQKLKRSLLSKATQFQETKFLQRAVSTWSEYVFLRQLGRLAADHWRRRLLKHGLHTLMKWKDTQQELEETQQDNTIRETLSMYRKLRDKENPQIAAQPDTPLIRAVSTTRAQPRRPAFLYEDGDHTRRTKFGLKDGEEIKNSGNLASKNVNMVAREVEWMEQILLDYEDIKVQIVKLRAELAVLLETRTPGEGNNCDPKSKIKMLQDQKTLLLQQEINSLEAKKMVQMPLIQAVFSRVQDLRTKRVST